MDVPLIEQIRIQAQVLVPLVKTLQAELGEERANALVRKALGELYRKVGEQWWQSQGERGLGEKMAAAFDNFAAGGALAYEVVKNAPDAFEVNVTGCRYAGSMTGSARRSWDSCWCAARISPWRRASARAVRLTRTQTIMQGASHCDFRYRLEASEEDVR